MLLIIFKIKNMENYCECGIYYEGFNSIINYFMKNYKKFSAIKSKDIKNKTQYDKLESQYNSLKQTIESIPIKGTDCISSMNNCTNNHKEEIKDIKTKLDKIKVLSERIEKYHKQLLNEIPDELDEYSDEEENNNIKNEEDEDDDVIYENVDVRQTMKNDQDNIRIIENLLDNAELKALKEEELKKLLKLKNELIEMWNAIEIELHGQGEQIDNVDENVDKALNHVDKGDDELEKAAKSAINRRRLAYQGGLALTLGAIGSIVPGIGNAIGLALGGLIGYGIYRADKHRLNKVLKKKKKIREERNKK